MTLTDQLQRIQTADVLLTEGRSLFARAIRLRTRSQFSHAGMCIWVWWGRAKKLAVIEALDWQGVRLYPVERYVRDCTARGERVHWYALVDPAVNRQHAAELALGAWGSQYASWKQFAASFARWSRPVWQLAGLADTDTDPFRWHCSELVASSLFYGGYYPPEGDETKPWRCTPGDISQFTCLQRRGILLPAPNPEIVHAAA